MQRLLRRLFGTVPGVRWLVLGIFVVTIACAIVARWLAQEDFPTIGDAMWWSVQTVTTVGYGDATPQTSEGKVIAALLMIASVALISVMTASIAAGFVNRRQAQRKRDDPVLDALERIERRLAALEKQSGSASDG
jgi:voltage-gated potassium channel